MAAVASHVGVDLPDSASDKARTATTDLQDTAPGRARGELMKGDNGSQGDDASTDGRAKADAKANNAGTHDDARNDAGQGADDAGTAVVETPNNGGTGTATDASGDHADPAVNDAAGDHADPAAKGAGNANSRRP